MKRRRIFVVFISEGEHQIMQGKTENLIKACKRGNELAQMQIYDLYCKAMFNVALRYLNDKEDAKDAMQEGFLKAFLKIGTYEPRSSFGSWLKRIIINQCLDALKKKKMLFADIDVEVVELPNDDWSFDSQITKDQVLKAIDNLKDEHKLVVKLYLLEGYDHGEISEILEIPKETSRTYLHRGKKALKHTLKSYYNEAGY